MSEVKTIQDKIMRFIRKRITDRRLEAVERWPWANRGTIYVQPINTLETMFKVVVSFDDSQFTGAILYEGERLINGIPHNSNNQMQRERYWPADYSDHEGLSRFLWGLEKELDRYAPKPVPVKRFATRGVS